jgi:hypothetical protein
MRVRRSNRRAVFMLRHRRDRAHRLRGMLTATRYLRTCLPRAHDAAVAKFDRCSFVTSSQNATLFAGAAGRTIQCAAWWVTSRRRTATMTKG